MLTHQSEFDVRTTGRGTTDIGRQVAAIVADSGITTGICQIFLLHTSASLIVCENADPAVRRDLEAFFARLVPDGDALFEHTDEGPDDMPAHVRNVLTQTTLSVPVSRAAPALGTWQGLYLWEHRHAPHTRRMLVTVVGSP